MTNELTRFSHARAGLICDHPFFGALALRLRLQEDESVPTACVNGHVIRFNPQFTSKLTVPQLRTLLAHEVLHCVFEHIPRLHERQPYKWNQACDYAINWVLHEARFTPIAGWLCDPQYAGMTADDIYLKLPEDPNHENPALDELRDDNDDGSGHNGLTSGRASAVQTAVDWKIAATQAAAMAKATGSMPASLARFIDDMNTPKVNWREYLSRFAHSVSKDDYAWHRPNRKALANGLLLPGLFSENIEHLAVVVDTSGSIEEKVLQAFAAELRSIQQNLKPQTLHLMYCDSAVQKHEHLTPHEPLNLQAVGGGGTDFRPPFERLNAQGVRPAALVYLTDLQGPFPDAAPDYPVLWCSTTDDTAPWGETLRIHV